MKILITGSSGFIWFHVAQALLDRWYLVAGIDNENNYYDVALKQARRKHLEQNSSFSFHHTSLENLAECTKVFEKEVPDIVLNLAAQAGVRYSLIDPYSYIQTNIVGFHNIIELSKQYKVKNFVYASSASVYWWNTKIPFSVEDQTDQPLSLYGATKKSNELIAHAYHSMFDMNVSWLRFFNVYGPRGRPDGAFFIFTKGILSWTPIDVYNYGKSVRNFTYIDDIVDAVLQILEKPLPCEIYNLWNPTSVLLDDMITYIESACQKKVTRNYLPLQQADIPESGVDISLTKKHINREPRIGIEEGVQKLVSRYRDFYTM